MSTYMSGSLVRTSCLFYDISGSLADPDVVTFHYRMGAGSTSTITPQRDSTGSYHHDIDTTGWSGPGNQLVVYEYTGTGTVQAISAGSFEITEPALLP